MPHGAQAVGLAADLLAPARGSSMDAPPRALMRSHVSSSSSSSGVGDSFLSAESFDDDFLPPLPEQYDDDEDDDEDDDDDDDGDAAPPPPPLAPSLRLSRPQGPPSKAAQSDSDAVNLAALLSQDSGHQPKHGGQAVPPPPLAPVPPPPPPGV